MSDAPVPKRWRFRLSCLGMLGVGVASLVILIGIVGVWSSTTGDLEAVDARAKAMGLPLTWDEVGLVQSPPTMLDDWRRLQQLAASVKSYQASIEDYWTPKVGEPIPEALRAHHAVLPQAELAELLALCDGLRPGVVTVRTAYDDHTLLPEIETMRELAHFFSERVCLASRENLLAEHRRHAAVTMASPPQTGIQHLVVFSLISIWGSSVAQRLVETHDAAESAALVDEVRQWTGCQADQVFARYFLSIRGGVQGLASGKSSLADYIGLLDNGARKWMGVPGTARVVVRLVRRTWLETCLTLDQGWRRDPSLAARVDVLRQHDAELVAQSRSPLGRWSCALTAPLSMLGWQWIRADTQLAVLAAELRGQPWPADPTDPTGGRVRPLMRDGRVIGFYLLGKDGMDGGGKGDDKAYPLYEALVKP